MSDHSQSPPIRLEIRPHAGLPRLRGYVQRAIELTTFGLSSAAQFNGVPDPTAGAAVAYQFNFRPQSSEAIRGEFRRFLLSASFRDVIEALNEFVEVIGESCSAFQLLEQRPGSREEAEQFLAQAKKRLHKAGLPQKLDEIRALTASLVVPTSEAHILSINRCRNCLVHRLGVVSEADAKENNALEVSWLHMDLNVTSATGQKRVELPYVVGEGEDLFLQQVVRRKRFGVGDKIEFSASELMEVCWTVILFAEALADNVSEFAKTVLRPTTE